MKRFCIASALVLFAGISPANAAAPQAPGANLPHAKGPVLQPNFAKPSNKGGKKKGGNQSKAGTESGVMTSMTVGKQGDILDIYLKVSGSTRKARIRGCGAKSAAHPLLNWVFQERRLVHIAVDSAGCLSNVLIPR